jgi:LETM1 and EF-hand domain-containing protein 1
LQSIPGRLSDKSIQLGNFVVEQLKELLKDPMLLKAWTVAAWSGLVHFVKHMYVGSKLLGKNVRIASSLLARSAMGRKLIRREEKLLLRTVSDLGRLIPFSFFVIVPFMELLLPVALKMFPNLLPSTFEQGDQRDARHKRTVAMRLTLAKVALLAFAS